MLEDILLLESLHTSLLEESVALLTQIEERVSYIYNLTFLFIVVFMVLLIVFLFYRIITSSFY